MWARIKDAAQEVEVTATDPRGRYTPDIEAQFFPCYSGVTTGSIFLGGDAMQVGSWTIYVPPAPPIPAPPPPATVNGGRFYVLFTPTQRIAIKASADAMVKEFYSTLQVCISSGEPIDLGSTAVQQGLAYLVSQGIIASGDVTRITANTLP